MKLLQRVVLALLLLGLACGAPSIDQYEACKSMCEVNGGAKAMNVWTCMDSPAFNDICTCKNGADFTLGDLRPFLPKAE